MLTARRYRRAFGSSVLTACLGVSAGLGMGFVAPDASRAPAAPGARPARGRGFAAPDASGATSDACSGHSARARTGVDYAVALPVSVGNADQVASVKLDVVDVDGRLWKPTKGARLSADALAPGSTSIPGTLRLGDRAHATFTADRVRVAFVPVPRSAGCPAGASVTVDTVATAPTAPDVSSTGAVGTVLAAAAKTLQAGPTTVDVRLSKVTSYLGTPLESASGSGRYDFSADTGGFSLGGRKVLLVGSTIYVNGQTRFRGVTKPRPWTSIETGADEVLETTLPRFVVNAMSPNPSLAVSQLAWGATTAVRTGKDPDRYLVKVDLRRAAANASGTNQRPFQVALALESLDRPVIDARVVLDGAGRISSVRFTPPRATVGAATFELSDFGGSAAVTVPPASTVTNLASYLPSAERKTRTAVKQGLDTAVTEYRALTSTSLATLADDTDRLAEAIDQGDLDSARSLWLTAHLDYERMGAAYGTFGDFAAKIDGRPDGLPGGVDDPAFTGFLRLERALWNDEPVAVAATVAHQLAADVHGLVSAFPTQVTDPLDLPLRAHEILENTQQFEITGQTDMGSHTNLATARANVDGTRTVLGVLAPLLQARKPSLLGTATAGLDQLGALLDTFHNPDGSWIPVESLTLTQRQHLDATLGALLEGLAAVPDVLETRPPPP